MITILQGDVRDRLRGLADESVHCVVTSPPYWGLRDYGVKGQIGMEPTVFEHIELLVDVFREVRRVLRKDGTLWLNYGDAYSGRGKGGNPGPNGMQDRNKGSLGVRGVRRSPFKDKDRMLLPARLAIALQDDGWWIRDEIIWHKPNPMPSSVKDRTTPAHEMIYLLSQAPNYYFDQEAILEPCSENTHARMSQNVMAQIGSARANAGGKTNGPMRAVTRGSGKMAAAGSGIAYNESFSNAIALPVVKRNPRSVWTVSLKGFKEAHFATFPPKLIEPCILAGCPAGGTVLDPFFGAGTTGLVAQQHGRNCIGIELNPAYVLIATRRLGLGIFG